MKLSSIYHCHGWSRGGAAAIAAVVAFVLLTGAPGRAAAAENNSVTVIQDRTERVTTEVKTRTVESTTQPPKGARRVAIFVENRSKSVPNENVLFFEDQVSSQLGGKEFAVISREEVMKAKKVYPTEFGGEVAAVRASSDSARATAISRGAAAESVATRASVEVVLKKPTDQNEAANRNSLGTDQDRLMSDNASALRLAQLMGAEFILFANIGSYDKETTTVDLPDRGVKLRNTVHTLRGTYKIIDGYEGASQAGGPFKVSKSYRQTDTVKVDHDDVAAGLLEQAAAKVANELLAKAESIERTAKPVKANIHIAAYVKDLAGNEISLPNLRLAEGEVANEPDKWPAMVSANVEIDGVVMGTTPARVSLFPGVHKLRLTRPGFQTYDGYFLAEDGLTLTPSLWMDEGGFQRWREIRDFLSSLDERRALNKAQVSVLEGYAQMLRQSGFLVKIEKKEDVTINSKKPPTYNIVRSLWDYWRGF